MDSELTKQGWSLLPLSAIIELTGLTLVTLNVAVTLLWIP